MRRDLAIALLISLLLHAGLALGFSGKPKLGPSPVLPPTMEIMPIPPLEPDEPLPPTQSSEQPAAAAASVGPQQADLPPVRFDSPFLQPIQPAPPPNLGRPTGLISIPTHGLAGGADFKDIFDLSELDQNPMVLVEGPVAPLQLAGLTGEIEVGFIIDERGIPLDLYIIRSSQPALNKPALDAIAKSKFIPGKKGGHAVSTRVRRTLVITPPKP